MQEAENWLAKYGESHGELRFAVIHWLAVLTLVVATVGMLWSLPIPQEFVRISPVLNWGSAFLMATVVYYFIISMALAIGMLPFIFGIALGQVWLLNSPLPHARLSAGLFVASLIGLYLGHVGSGGLRAVVRDVQLMMIAPLWILSNLYRRIGIPY